MKSTGTAITRKSSPQTGFWGGYWSLPELAANESVVLAILSNDFSAQVSFL